MVEGKLEVAAEAAEAAEAADIALELKPVAAELGAAVDTATSVVAARDPKQAAAAYDSYTAAKVAASSNGKMEEAVKHVKLEALLGVGPRRKGADEGAVGGGAGDDLSGVRRRRPSFFRRHLAFFWEAPLGEGEPAPVAVASAPAAAPAAANALAATAAPHKKHHHKHSKKRTAEQKTAAEKRKSAEKGKWEDEAGPR